MSTLTTAPLAPLLENLFRQADETASPSWDDITPEDRARLMGSKTDYIALYSRLKDLWLPVSRETGRLLYILARGANAWAII